MNIGSGENKSCWLKRSVRYQIHRNHVHPWTGEEGWDGMHVEADTESALSDFIAAAQRRFLAVWIRSNIGEKRAFLYKPHGTLREWIDPQPN